MISEIRDIDINKCKEDVFHLWQEAFGDSKEEISFFINNCQDYRIIGNYYNGVLASMLFLVNCKVEEVDCKYIYVACTLEDFKKLGLMTELLEKCKEKYSFISLIPANESLVDFYEKRGFKTHLSLKSLAFEQTDEISDYLISGCELEKPHLLCYRNGEF